MTPAAGLCHHRWQGMPGWRPRKRLQSAVSRQRVPKPEKSWVAARGESVRGEILDNGQHILSGAYSTLLDLMQRTGCQTLTCSGYR